MYAGTDECIEELLTDRWSGTVTGQWQDGCSLTGGDWTCIINEGGISEKFKNNCDILRIKKKYIFLKMQSK